MRTQSRFRTSLFRPLGADDDQSENGRELAVWLCANLPAEMQPESFAEDWGYRIVFGSPALHSALTLCCGYVEEDQWSCFCDPERSGSADGLEAVVRALDELLSNTPSITEVEWFENDARFQEFNHGPRAFS